MKLTSQAKKGNESYMLKKCRYLVVTVVALLLSACIIVCLRRFRLLLPQLRALNALSSVWDTALFWCDVWPTCSVEPFGVVVNVYIENLCAVFNYLLNRRYFRFDIYSVRGRGAKYCAQRVCLFVCLSVRSHISKTARTNFTTSSVRVTRGRGSVLLRRQCIL